MSCADGSLILRQQDPEPCAPLSCLHRNPFWLIKSMRIYRARHSAVSPCASEIPCHHHLRFHMLRGTFRQRGALPSLHRAVATFKSVYLVRNYLLKGIIHVRHSHSYHHGLTTLRRQLSTLLQPCAPPPAPDNQHRRPRAPHQSSTPTPQTLHSKRDILLSPTPPDILPATGKPRQLRPLLARRQRRLQRLRDQRRDSW